MTLKELLLLSGVFALTTAGVLQVGILADGRGAAGLFVAVPFIIPLLVLGPLWLSAHLQRSRPRCYSCAVNWRPNSLFSRNPVHPGLVVLLMLFIAVQYLVLPLIRSEAFLGLHLVLMLAVIPAVLILSDEF